MAGSSGSGSSTPKAVSPPLAFSISPPLPQTSSPAIGSQGSFGRNGDDDENRNGGIPGSEATETGPGLNAFCTLLTSDSYLPGALVLAHALNDLERKAAAYSNGSGSGHHSRKASSTSHSSDTRSPPKSTTGSGYNSNPYSLVCLVTPATVSVEAIKALRGTYDLVVGVEEIKTGEANQKELRLLGRQDLSSTLTKLHVFRLVQFSRIIFLDADTLPLRPLSHLFSTTPSPLKPKQNGQPPSQPRSRSPPSNSPPTSTPLDFRPTEPRFIPLPFDDVPTISAAPDSGWPDCFNSGFIVLHPSVAVFERLIKMKESKGSWDGGDQGLLNEFFRGEGLDDEESDSHELNDASDGPVNSSGDGVDMARRGQGDGYNEGGSSPQKGKWNRLPFRYNVTPSAYYTYAPAYRRHGASISLVHFIGQDKPWNHLNRHRPYEVSEETAKSTSNQHDYYALVDKWFDVYEHYYGQVATPEVAHAANVGISFGPGVPSTGTTTVSSSDSDWDDSVSPGSPASLSRGGLPGPSAMTKHRARNRGRLTVRFSSMPPSLPSQLVRSSSPKKGSAGFTIPTYSQAWEDPNRIDYKPVDPEDLKNMFGTGAGPLGNRILEVERQLRERQQHSYHHHHHPYHYRHHDYHHQGHHTPPVREGFYVSMPLPGRPDLLNLLTPPKVGSPPNALTPGTLQPLVVSPPHQGPPITSVPPSSQNFERGHEQPGVVGKRPFSPPPAAWDGTRAPPPTDSQEYQMREPIDSHYENIWDAPRTQHGVNEFFRGPNAYEPIPDEIRENYQRILEGERGAPDPSKVKPIFPWEEKGRAPPPARKFPDDHSSPRGPPPQQVSSGPPSFSEFSSASTSASVSTQSSIMFSGSSTSTVPTPPGHGITVPKIQTEGLPKNLNRAYANAWDDVKSIKKYADALSTPTRSRKSPPSKYSPPLDDAYEDGESSREGDDEDEDGPRPLPSRRGKRSHVKSTSSIPTGGPSSRSGERRRGVRLRSASETNGGPSPATQGPYPATFYSTSQAFMRPRLFKNDSSSTSSSQVPTIKSLSTSGLPGRPLATTKASRIPPVEIAGQREGVRQHSKRGIAPAGQISFIGEDLTEEQTAPNVRLDIHDVKQGLTRHPSVSPAQRGSTLSPRGSPRLSSSLGGSATFQSPRAQRRFPSVTSPTSPPISPTLAAVLAPKSQTVVPSRVFDPRTDPSPLKRQGILTLEKFVKEMEAKQAGADSSPGGSNSGSPTPTPVVT